MINRTFFKINRFRVVIESEIIIVYPSLITNKKHFPKWNIEVNHKDDPKYNPFDFRDTEITVVYKLPSSYKGDTTMSLIANINGIKFMTIGKNEIQS